MKIPLTVEVVSETGEGKTHLIATCFPNPYFIDSTDTIETPLVLKKLFKDYETRWLRVHDWNEMIIAVDKALAAGAKTIEFDVGKHLQKLAIPVWAKEAGRKRPMPYEYDEVRDYGLNLLRKITDAECNVAIATQMKDEIVADKSTGSRIPDSFKPIPIASRLIVFIRRGEADANGVKTRQYKVIKNASRDSADAKDWIQFIEGLKAGTTVEERAHNWSIIKQLMKIEESEACQ